ncbi:MAG: phospholipid carrier-dependent glycosyltransferase [Acidimicrobiales bacterium]
MAFERARSASSARPVPSAPALPPRPAAFAPRARRPRPASQPGGQALPPSSTFRSRWLQPVDGGILVAALAAVGLLAFQLHQSNFLFGVIEYDDAVNLGAAVRLVHGALPYRDFVLMQPPGLPLLISPVALLSRLTGTRDAMAIARLLTIVVAGGNVVLLGRLLRHRGAPATFLGCTVLAAFSSAILTARTFMLEPYLVLFCLIGAVACFEGDQLTSRRRRLILAGVAFGFAGSVKIWAILPVVVIVVLCLPAVRRRALPFVWGVAAGFAVPCAPFFFAAPMRFVNEVIVVQLSRVTNARMPIGIRLEYLTGLYGSGLHLSRALVDATTIGIGLFVAGAFVVTQLSGSRLPLSRLEAFVLGSAAIVGLSLLVPTEFYYHYADWFAPFLAGLICLAAARWGRSAVSVAGWLGRTAGAGPRAGPNWPARVTASVILLVGVGVLASGGQFSKVNAAAAPDPGKVIEQHVPPGACVLTDLTSQTLSASRMVSSDPSCPLLIDSFGTDLSLAGGRTLAAGGASVPAVQRRWLTYFEGARYVVLSSPHTARIPWTPAITAYFATHFVRLKAPGVFLFERIAA